MQTVTKVQKCVKMGKNGKIHQFQTSQSSAMWASDPENIEKNMKKSLFCVKILAIFSCTIADIATQLCTKQMLKNRISFLVSGTCNLKTTCNIAKMAKSEKT